MAEHECQKEWKEHGHEDTPPMVAFTSAEEVISPSGESGVLIGVTSNCSEINKDLQEETKRSREKFGKSATTAFSSSKWTATWEPSGPKKNWVIEPPDPRAN